MWNNVRITQTTALLNEVSSGGIFFFVKYPMNHKLQASTCKQICTCTHNAQADSHLYAEKVTCQTRGSQLGMLYQIAFSILLFIYDHDVLHCHIQKTLARDYVMWFKL